MVTLNLVVSLTSNCIFVKKKKSTHFQINAFRRFGILCQLLTVSNIPRRHGVRGKGPTALGTGYPAEVLPTLAFPEPRATAQLLQLQKNKQGMSWVVSSCDTLNGVISERPTK